MKMQFHIKIQEAQADIEVMLIKRYDVLPGAEFEPDGCMDADRLWVLGVVPEFNRASGSCLVNYKKDGTLMGREYRIP